MNKPNFVLSALAGVGITVGLLGCSGEGANLPLESQTQSVPVRMVASYAPSTGTFPLPNDLVFNGTADLTLNIPVADPEDFSDPSVAISALDGWSAVAPFSISFASADASVSLDANSVVGGSSVRVFKVNTFRADVVPGIPGPTGPVTGVERELTAGLEYVVQATSATSVAIVPTVPFEQQAAYMVILTNGLMDSNGLPILHDAEYAIAQSTNPIAEDSVVAGLEGVRQLVNAMEAAASDFDSGPARTDIIQSFQFVVQSVGAVMESAKLAYIDGPLLMGATPVTSFSSLGTDTTPFTTIGAADLYKGSIALTYLLAAPSEENPTAPLNTMWKALEMLPIGPEGANVPNPFGENLTYANSFPRANGVELAPLLVSMPKAVLGCTKPEDGYPVAIFQHGITSNRTTVLGIADSLAAPPSCTAAVAMDMPLHGIDESNLVHQGLLALELDGVFEDYAAGGLRERTFGVDYVNNESGAPGPDQIVDASGTHTINLGNLLVARDNNRQAIFDLLYLEKAIAYMDIDGEGADFDADKISYIGHSLGGIVGTGVIAYSDNIKAAALVNPGGGIALMLNGSDSFGPRIRAGVAGAAGMTVEDPAFPATLSKFMFAAQTVLDSMDPANTSAHAVVNGVPTLMLQNLGDSVVPNSVVGAPLAGTEPLARVMALETLVAEEPGLVAGSRIFTKLNVGGHGSVLLPDVATVEMQSQIVSFLSSGGMAVQVVDPTLLDD